MAPADTTPKKSADKKTAGHGRRRNLPGSETMAPAGCQMALNASSKAF
jgi:hypothetical protein